MSNVTQLFGKKVLYHTFGCKLNFAETATISASLSRLGLSAVSGDEAPDVVLINSCSVTELADKKCRQFIRSINRRYPDAAIAVTGCYAQLKPEEIMQLPGVKIVTGNSQKLAVVDAICNWFERAETLMTTVKSKDIRIFTPSCSRGDRTRYFLKVQDGCDYYCSYCTIPYARGRSRSGTIASIVEQARKAADEGGKEIVITGVNIGDFGKGTSETFFDLIRRLDEVEGIERYRISSIEPNLLTDDMIRWIPSSRAFMPHFHIPLQNGDNDVLRLMRRRYDTELFRHKIDLIREYIPHAFIGVDLIVGARGETEEAFARSRRFVESLPISRLHVFPYSERPGTRALTDIDHVVSQEDKHKRAEIMGRISDDKLHAFNASFIGQVRNVLVEHTCTDGRMHGFTDNYIKVSMPVDSSLFNSIVPVRLVEQDGEEMKGEVQK